MKKDDIDDSPPVAIARAIVNQPKLLLADEPTGALDSQMSQEIMGIFAELNQQGMILVMVTHDPEVAQRCQRTITFRDGSVLSDSYDQTSHALAGGSERTKQKHLSP